MRPLTIKEALRAGRHVGSGTGVATVVVSIIASSSSIHLSTTASTAAASSTSVVGTATAAALRRGGIRAVAATGRHTATLSSRVVGCSEEGSKKKQKEMQLVRLTSENGIEWTSQQWQA